METVWQIVIHAAYDEQKALYDKIISACDRYLVCQHDADEKVNRTHCHILFEGPKRTRPSIQTWITQAGCGGRGNYAIFTKTHDRTDLAKYMIKGNKAHVKATSFAMEQIQLWEQQWVNREKLSPAVPESAKTAVKTQWEIMSEIIAETRAYPGVWVLDQAITTGDDGIILDGVWVCRNRRYVWDTMLKHLAKNKIRTSIHELERWFVTMMREERDTSEEIFNRIVGKFSK